ncbi:BREX-1 system adenine-specific DNA-methyltransferase PglX [Candidatus Accumulibacter sp. ACC003]|uniref:BREX-1 system adenine-specific DNA-methyltransferase PglX n=1 Tax=Candidatus Accumulibacter sp. ACC003 TaxID=2823334 RepID=UPI0025C1869B|nr:BREX-1 system adenine-specific DNA-methyltransferase PglX [Candidatus Accumulibacter sp. ACC003]
MNTAKLKSYAPQARRDFIAAVQARANQLGLSVKGGKLDIAPSEQKGDIVVIAGQAWPAKVHQQRERLIQRIKEDGFAHTIEAVAYTWFNRFAALRYMEIHDYLDHGYRALSSREGGLPEILAHASELVGVLPGLNAAQIADLRLAGDKDGELYRLLLVAQCNALASAMPFLFERIDDESELLLPDKLIRSDSLIASLVDEIPEADWSDIEIIGWLYQFYISEKKDQVIGKVVKSEDIPAATQLFTPNWIVKYMVQNSLGAQWLATYPDSPLKAQMDYYIEPAEQTDEVKAQLAAITPSQLNPEELTLIDPACGSGHILVEAYELFKAIYLERGYRQRDVAQLILEKNLYGLDIDERAAQLTGFALMMKGRADDRWLFERGVKPNVMSLVDSAGFDAEGLAKGVELSDYGLKPGDLNELKRLFEHATTFGSLIQVPEGLADKLSALKKLSAASSQDLFVSDALKPLGPLVQQAELLAAQYDAAVANPPYMGSKAYCMVLKEFVNNAFAAGKADLYGTFVLRNIQFAQQGGHVGMITIPNWMFLSSFEELRKAILNNAPISSLVHNGRGIWGSDFGSCSFILRRAAPYRLSGSFLRLFEKPGSVSSNEEQERRFHTKPRYCVANAELARVPGAPVAYWAPSAVIEAFESGCSIGASAKKGLSCSGTELFYRYFWEVSSDKLANVEKRNRWVEIAKGGDYRKWFGNNELRIDWGSNGASIKKTGGSVVRNERFYFRPGLSWNDVSIGQFACRFVPAGAIPTDSGPMIFEEAAFPLLACVLNSRVAKSFLEILCPTVHFGVGQIARFPVLEPQGFLENSFERLLYGHRIDWNVYERSLDFQSLPILAASSEPTRTLESSYTAWITQNRATIAEMKRLEEENNRLFIDAYGLQDELTPDVPLSQITLTVNPAYRYGGKLSEEEQWTRFRQDTMEELVSYAIGCMMGRYSLDEPGLIYAHAGNVGFDATRYQTFPADADGIVPVTDELWFEDDAANRVREFLIATWGAEKLDENMVFLADNLGAKASEAPIETIRRYLADKFFKDHLQTYKKRPIYWLFSSGKQGGFQALLYLHRYHEGTLARMRAEYVVPLTGKIQSRIEMLEKDRDAAGSTASRNKIAKQIESLKRKHVELLAYDEKLRHYADMRITLDLDDGVKVNYGKFGDLLAEVKAVTGGASDD